MTPETIAKLITEDIQEANGLKSKIRHKMPTRKLGKTGYDVGLMSLGGQGSLERQGNEKNCIRIIQRAIELGVNFVDTSPIYGPSEDYYGKALKGLREKVFLASKTDDRTRDGSLRLIEKSLKRLKTDYLDLWQIHHLDTIEEVDEVTNEDGALQALLEMQEEKVVKHLGFTGHQDPDILLEMSKRHDFDTVLCAVNAADVHTKKPFMDKFIPEANKQKLGIIGMKIFGQGYLLKAGGVTTAWEAINYALSLPINTVIVGCDTVAQLEENVVLAKAFRQLDEEEMTEIENLTKDYPREACFYKKQYGGYNSKKKLKRKPALTHKKN